MKIYLLVDANNLVARTHYAMRDLRTRDGFRTGGLYGFLKGLSWVRHRLQVPLHQTCLFWDGGHAAKRKKLLPQYKQGRRLHEPKTAQDKIDREVYLENLRLVKEVLGWTQVKQIEVPGTEADDLIAIFARIFERERERVIIYSGDHDFHQLYRQTYIEIFDPKKDLLSALDIKNRWGVTNTQKIPLWKALVGDTSDNIPGVSGVGKKRVQKLLPYLMWKWPKASWIARGENMIYQRVADPPESETVTRKWLDVATTWENARIVRRNLRLMVLPRTFEDFPYYNQQQVDSSFDQWMKTPTVDRRKFFQALDRYELESIIETVNTW